MRAPDDEPEEPNRHEHAATFRPAAHVKRQRSELGRVQAEAQGGCGAGLIVPGTDCSPSQTNESIPVNSCAVVES